MKRNKPLKRKTPLRSSGIQSMPQEYGTGIFSKPRKALSRKTRIAPISARQRAKKAVRAAQVAAEGQNFRAAIAGRNCIVCGRSEAKAYEETGEGHQAHHGIRQEVLKRLHLESLLWSRGNALCVCEEPCHRRHTLRYQRILRLQLPASFVAWAETHGLTVELEREYPA